jgi:hypothetical protein
VFHVKHTTNTTPTFDVIKIELLLSLEEAAHLRKILKDATQCPSYPKAARDAAINTIADLDEATR